MRLVSITLTDFRGVTDRTVDFSDGVTIVEGPNEVGKSSIPEAIRLLRTMKASSKHRDIHAVKAIGRDSGPAAEVHLHTGPYDLTYRKRWLKSPETVLTVHAPAPEQLTGDAAHERFDAILAETADLNLVTALEIVQGHSLATPEFAPIVSLQRALDDTAGEFEGHDDLMAAIQAEFAVYFTPRGQETGEYRDSEGAAAAREQECEELRARSEQMDVVVSDRARAAATRDRIADELAAARAASVSWRAAAAQLDTLTRAADDAGRSLTAAEQRHQRAQRESADRAALRQEVDTRTVQLSGLREVVRQRSELERMLLSGQASATEKVREAEHVREISRAAAEASSRSAVQFRQRLELRLLADRVKRAHGARVRGRAAAAELEVNRVGDEALEAIESASTEVRLAEAARDAATARVRVRSLDNHPITVDGAALAAGAEDERRARTPVRVDIADIAEIIVEPGTPPADLELRLEDARQVLAAALHDVGAESLEAARLGRQQRREAEATRASAAAALESILAGDDLAQLEERLAALETQAAASAQSAAVQRANVAGADVAGAGGLGADDTSADAIGAAGTGPRGASAGDVGAGAGGAGSGSADAADAGGLGADAGRAAGAGGAGVSASEPAATSTDSGSADAAAAGGAQTANDAATAVATAGPGAVERVFPPHGLGDDAGHLAELEATAATAAARDREADDELQDARLRAAEHERSLAQARERRIRAEAERDSASGEHERAAALLAAARAERDDATLETAVALSATEKERARAAADEAETALASADPDTILMQRDNADALVESKGAQLAASREEVVRLDALLEERAGEGLYDQLATAEAALDAAIQRRDHLRRRAAAAQLLRDTMVRHRDLAQERYVAPFAERIDGLGRVVFGPDFAVQVSKELALVSRTLDGTTVPFDSLSAGAKEQLALLGRLACAQLVADDEGAPVVLDDALGFADPERLASVGAVLGRVGRSAQVIVLTCQPDRYAHVGGATTVTLRRGASG